MRDADTDTSRLTLRRRLSVEPTLVRGILHDLARSGEWAELSGHGDEPVEIHIADGGSGSAVIEVSQQIAVDRRDQVAEVLTRALDELDRRLIERTTDAS